MKRSEQCLPIHKRFLRFIWLSGIIFFSVTLLLTLLLRFVNPPMSGLMLERVIEARWSKKVLTLKQRWVPLQRMSPHVQRAVVTAEDQRFYDHYGFDWQAIGKAIQHNQSNHTVRGASTISQQTAKNVFLWSNRSWLRKALEVYFTVLIELCWSKQRTMEVYLNIIEWGNGIFGIEAAAKHYFGKSAAQLNREEAALLTAIIPNPRRMSASQPSEYVLERQQWILDNMHRTSIPTLSKH